VETLILDHNVFQMKKMKVFINFVRQSKIHTLSLNNCKLGDEGGVTLGEAIENSHTIKDVRAKCCDFSDGAARAIATAIEQNPRLERLNLSNNLINDAGGELIGLSIARNKKLKYLNLSKNNMRQAAGDMFAKSMKLNKTLNCLKLENNFVNMSFLEQIDRLIERNNLNILDNYVSELRQDRQGLLSSRKANWTRVDHLRITQMKKEQKLEVKVKDLA